MLINLCYYWLLPLSAMLLFKIRSVKWAKTRKGVAMHGKGYNILIPAYLFSGIE
jgi:hypothetical protein